MIELKKWRVPLGVFHCSEEQKKAVNEILDSTRITEGKYVKLFEGAWAKYIGVKHCIAVNSGTSALTLIYVALRNLKGRSRVVVPATTYAATLNAAVTQGFDYLLKDVDKDMLLSVNLEELSYARVRRNDILVPVHLFGYSCNMEKIMKYKKELGYSVVEDCCESHGALFKGKRVGSIGDAGAFSFYPSHNVQVGEMGCVTTNNDQLAEEIRSLKDNGRVHSIPGYVHDRVGFNFKTTELTAALGYFQALDAEVIRKKRFVVAKAVQDGVKKKVKFFPVKKDFSMMALPFGARTKAQRSRFIKSLNKAGVETRLMFPSLSHQKPFVEDNKSFSFANASRFEDTWFCVPCHQYMDEKDVDAIVKAIAEVKK